MTPAELSRGIPAYPPILFCLSFGLAVSIISVAARTHPDTISMTIQVSIGGASVIVIALRNQTSIPAQNATAHIAIMVFFIIGPP